MNNFQSQRVRLRAFEREDIDLALKWFNDLELMQYIHTHYPMTRIAEEKWYEKMALADDKVVFIIDALSQDGGYVSIGNCGLHAIDWKDRRATAGIAIGEKGFWSNGYGSEAFRLLVDYGFNHLNLHRIDSSVYDCNERSLKMHFRLGFEHEGYRRLAIFKNGRYVDEVIFGILREEWTH